jgi:hypothetical protein
LAGVASQAVTEHLLQGIDRLTVMGPKLIEELEPLLRLERFSLKGEFDRVVGEEGRCVRQQRLRRQMQQPVRAGDNLLGRKIGNMIEPAGRRDRAGEMRRGAQPVKNIRHHRRVRLHRPQPAFQISGEALIKERV